MQRSGMMKTKIGQKAIRTSCRAQCGMDLLLWPETLTSGAGAGCFSCEMCVIGQTTLNREYERRSASVCWLVRMISRKNQLRTEGNTSRNLQLHAFLLMHTDNEIYSTLNRGPSALRVQRITVQSLFCSFDHAVLWKTRTDAQANRSNHHSQRTTFSALWLCVLKTCSDLNCPSFLYFLHGDPAPVSSNFSGSVLIKGAPLFFKAPRSIVFEAF